MLKRKIILILAACVMTACSQNVEEALLKLTITVRQDNADSRTVLGEDNSVSFVSGDHIAVFDGAAVKRDFTTSAVYDDGSGFIGV